MEEQKTGVQQKWLENFAGLNEQNHSYFKTILEKTLSLIAVSQMMQFNELYQSIGEHFLNAKDKVTLLQSLYWQELFLIWQRFALSQSWDAPSSEVAKDLPQVFIKDYYLLQTRHLEALLKLAEEINPDLVQQAHAHIKHIHDFCAAANFTIDDPIEWQEALEAQSENLLQSMQAILSDLKASQITA